MITMVTKKNDYGVVGKVIVIERLENSADLGIDVTDTRKVGLAHATLICFRDRS